MTINSKQDGHDGPEVAPWAFPIVWYSIKQQGFKSQPLGYKHRIFYDLTLWHTFWPHMTHFQTCTGFHQGKHPDQVSWVSDRNSGL